MGDKREVKMYKQRKNCLWYGDKYFSRYSTQISMEEQ